MSLFGGRKNSPPPSRPQNPKAPKGGSKGGRGTKTGKPK
jgi:hypothetical protein